MKVILRNSSLTFQTNEVEVSPEIRSLLTNAYGNVAESKMKAFQVFADSIGWGEQNSIYSKLDVLIIPVLLNSADYGNLAKVFYNLKTEQYEQWGSSGSQSTMAANVATYIDVTGDGIVPKKVAGAYAGFTHYDNTVVIKEYRPFAVFTPTGVTTSTGLTLMGVSGSTQYGVRAIFNDANNDAKVAATDGTNFKFSSSYQNIKLQGVYVIGDNKAFGRETEITADVNNLDSSTTLRYPGFGGTSVDGNANANSENARYKIIGFGQGLTDTEARVLRDALVRLADRL